MVLGCVGLIKGDWIIAPYHAFGADLVGKLLKCRDQRFLLVREICFHVLTVTGKRELKIIGIIL